MQINEISKIYIIGLISDVFLKFRVLTFSCASLVGTRFKSVQSADQ